MEDKNIKNMRIQSQRQQKQEKKATAAEEAEVIQLIVFNLGDEEYGADINQVREIIRTGTITPIPDSPDFIKGVSNVRGEIPVIIDLKARFFLPIKKDVANKHIVITEQEKNIFGLLVDEVTEVLRIPKIEIKSAPEIVTRIDREYVNGVITLENRLIILLDLTKVLSAEQLARLAELTQRHRALEERHRIEEEPAEVSVKAEESERKTAESQPEQEASLAGR